jgi:hypothetical protein
VTEVDVNGIQIVVQYVITVSTIGTILWRCFSWLNKKNADRVMQQRQEKELKAKEVRDYTDKRAEQLKQYTEKLALDLQTVTSKVATDLRESNEAINRSMLEKMKEMDTKLTTRANLTNGNVSNIRKDLLELSEDIEKLFDLTDRASSSGGDGQSAVSSSAVAAARRRSEGERRRRRRLEQINQDRESQEHPDTSDRGDRH